MATVWPAEVRIPGLQLRGDLPAHLRRPWGLRARVRLAGRPATGLEEQRGQLQCVRGAGPCGGRGLWAGTLVGGACGEGTAGWAGLAGRTRRAPPQDVAPVPWPLAGIPCTGNQTFSYDSQACDHTCLSLTDREAECHPSAVPVDGCNCPEGTYLNHKTECVRKAQCPCLLDNHGFILADQSTMVNGVVW